MKVAFCSVADLPINWKGGGGGGGELGISRPVDLCDNNNFRRFFYHVNESETKKLAAIKSKDDSCFGKLGKESLFSTAIGLNLYRKENLSVESV